MNARHPRVHGFSLLEALVAMAIASIAFAVLYRTVGQSAFNASTVEERAEAALVARSVLASATFAEDLVKRPEGQSGPWQWSVQVQPEQVVVREAGPRQAPPPLQAARVELSVTRDGRAVLAWTSWKPYRGAP
ncbi:MAG: prepilin-type N-terminal cleavage/methylation domain-containing protein [Comamonadaceae bacterium]|nr:prepilin-type N-terminal cleavage/methylation domain-containing protein [Comamonadaceae bacterium]